MNTGFGQSTNMGQSANMMSLKAPSAAPAAPAGGKRNSEFKRTSANYRQGDSGPPPRDRGALSRPPAKENKNYGSFLGGAGGDSSRPPLRGGLDPKRT